MSETMKVRVTLSAVTRMEWSEIVEVPKEFNELQLREVADKFYDEIDATEFVDDTSFWEKGELQRCDIDHVQETDTPKYSVNSDMEIEEIPEKDFAVYQRSEATMQFIVSARNAEEAKHKVEASEDAEDEFDGSVKDGGTWIDNVEEV